MSYDTPQQFGRLAACAPSRCLVASEVAQAHGEAEPALNGAVMHDERSYRTALKTSALTGASSLVQVLLGMVRSKAIAVVIGPAGIGMLGLLSSATGLVATVTGLGINSSGVRQVAAATGTGDETRIARVIYTLRRTSLVLGILGMALVVLFAKPIAKLSVGSAEYSRYLVLLAPLILFNTVNGGQTALLRGLRRITTLARLSILGALFGTLFAVPCVLLWHLDGIPPALLLTAATALITSWWYARRVKIPNVKLSPRQLWAESSALFGLGAVFMLTGLQSTAVQYALRTILLHLSDLNTVGQFLAATALSHVYVNFVLQAMGLDYMPRLAKAHHDETTCNRLVNEQTEIALLLAVPGVVGLTVLAPVIIPVLYSGRFAEAVDVFRWQCLGVLLKVASWPIGFVLTAKNKRGMFLATETAFYAAYLGGFFCLTTKFGLMGAAMAFPVAYLFYLALIFGVVRWTTHFAWSAGSRQVILVSFTAYTGSLACHAWLPQPWRTAAGLLLIVATACWAYRQLCERLCLKLARIATEKVRIILSHHFAKWTSNHLQ